MNFDNELNKGNILNFDTSGMYGILIENSNVILDNTLCNTAKSCVSVFKNSKLHYNNCDTTNVLYENVIWLNSIVNKDKKSTFQKSASLLNTNLIQTGSYINITVSTPTTFNNSGNGGLVDQNFYFSGYLINNNDKIYWSINDKEHNNIGQFYKDSNIALTHADFKNLLDKIPKNLNGYNVIFTINDNNILDDSITLDGFYNGKLFIYNLQINKQLICKNNSCEININNSIINKNTNNISLLFNNNYNINLNDVTFGKNLTDKNKTNLLMSGYNNALICFKNILFTPIYTDLELSDNKLLDNTNTYNNKFSFEENSEDTKKAISYLINNQLNELDKSNIILISDYNITDPQYNNLLYNHTHLHLYDEISALTDDSITSKYYYITSAVIADISPITYRGVDVGSIIGWPQYTADNGITWKPVIPDGFYNCSIGSDNPLGDFNIPIDIANPKDKYFNGQLAKLLSADYNSITFKIPHIPEVIGQKLNTNRLVYIIKYNNNFEHNQTSHNLFNKN